MYMYLSQPREVMPCQPIIFTHRGLQRVHMYLTARCHDMTPYSPLRGFQRVRMYLSQPREVMPCQPIISTHRLSVSASAHVSESTERGHGMSPYNLHSEAFGECTCISQREVVTCQPIISTHRLSASAHVSESTARGHDMSTYNLHSEAFSAP